MTSGPTSVPNYVYVTYIRASAEQVWRALTDADLTARYWGHANVSDWQPGSTWEHRRADGSGVVDVVGRVIKTEPPTRLVITFDDAPDAESPTRTVGCHLSRRTTPGHRPPHRDPRESPQPGDAQRHLAGIGQAVLANLKSLLETGEVLPQAPWEMTRAHA